MANGLPPPSIKIGEYLLKFEEEELGEDFEERARKELRETPEVVDDALVALRDLIRNRSLLICETASVETYFTVIPENGDNDKELLFPLDDEKRLIQFLRPCKYYPKSAYEKVKKLYTFKFRNPKLHDELVPSALRNPLLQDVLTVLPLRNQWGRRIFLVEVGKWKVKDVSLNELFRCILLLVEIAITEYRTQICGVDVIFDLEGLSIQHVYQVGPSFASNILHWAQECAPLRFKSHHIVNQPYVFNMLFAIFKPFLSQKFRNRIYFHGKDYKSLLGHIDGKYLPKKYGGTMDITSFNRMEFYELLCKYQDAFEEINKYGYYKKKS